MAAQANTVVCFTGRGRGGRGRTNGRTRAYINNVDVTDLTATLLPRNGKSLVQCAVLYYKCAKVAAVVGARGGIDTRSLTNSTAQRTASVVSVTGGTTNENATTNDSSVASEITERGLQNCSSFGRGAYGNN